MRSQQMVLIVGGLLLSLAATGCGDATGPGPKWPDPVTVSGKVTYKGKPFANGLVIFVPDGPTVGQGGSGQTNEAGEYKAQTRWSDQKMRDGLIPGAYKVAFSRFVKPDGTAWVADPNSAEGPASVGAREELPLELSNPGTSTKLENVSKDKTTYDFDIP